jgi:hypothetical protein
MIGGVSPEMCWASHKYEIKFWYTVATCWIFFVNYTMMHGSTNFMSPSSFHLLLRFLYLLGFTCLSYKAFKEWYSKLRYRRAGNEAHTFTVRQMPSVPNTIRVMSASGWDALDFSTQGGGDWKGKINTYSAFNWKTWSSLLDSPVGHKWILGLGIK